MKLIPRKHLIIVPRDEPDFANNPLSDIMSDFLQFLIDVTQGDSLFEGLPPLIIKMHDIISWAFSNALKV